MAAEHNLYLAVRRYLDELHRQGEPVQYRKVHGSPVQRRGEPDMDICYGGVAVKIELKAGRLQPTPLQRHRLAQWRASGAVVGVARSVDDIREIIQQAKERSDVWTQTQAGQAGEAAAGQAAAGQAVG